MMKQQYLATSPAGVGVYLAQELLSFGAEDVVERPVGVSFTGIAGIGLSSVPVESIGEPGHSPAGHLCRALHRRYL